jgi:general secretion pathway protein E
MPDRTETIQGLPEIAEADYPDAPVLAAQLKGRFLRHAHAVPLACTEQDVLLAMTDPSDDYTVRAVSIACGRRVRVGIARPSDLDAALERLYPAEQTALDDSDFTGLLGALSMISDDDAERLKDLASEAPIVRLVNQVIARAVDVRASDIHIEPFQDRLRIRYRQDGLLRETDDPPARLAPAIVSRIKIMAHLDIAERRLPQDGRIKHTVRGHDIDLRVTTSPSLHGEAVVIRVLDRSAVTLDFDSLGMTTETQAGLRRILGLPNGIVLVTGPTGSGKTTTLYTALLDLNSTERKIVTVEDPVEYQLSGINQIQVRPQIGLTFATLLRSMLRQDPDIIMIGEIRDLETARIAVQAALTGHLVLSTLHTNSAAASVTRLRDMGIEDYLLTATLNGVLAQRLVRRLCPACKEPAPSEDRGILACRPVGCASCRGTGFSGRLAITELFCQTAETNRLLLEGADHAALERAAAAGGMRTLRDEGMAAVRRGLTTADEIVRSVRFDG